MKLHKIVVLGDGAACKAALITQFCLTHPVVIEEDPTFKDSYQIQLVIDDEPCVLELLDTPEIEEYAPPCDQWISDGKGFLLVYSVSSRPTFERMERYRDQIVRVKGTDNVPIVLVGNQCDERVVSMVEGMNMARKLKCEFVESSTKTCVNVVRPFYSVVRMIRGYGPRRVCRKGMQCQIM